MKKNPLNRIPDSVIIEQFICIMRGKYVNTYNSGFECVLVKNDTKIYTSNLLNYFEVIKNER
jgi:hypothetical protein